MDNKKIRMLIVGDIIQWIERNLNGPLSLDDVTRRAGYSKWHFQRVFRDVTGINIAKYIKNRKLTEAAYILREQPDVSIPDVSDYFYFDSVQSFYRAFKGLFGITPTQMARGDALDECQYQYCIQLPRIEKS